MSVTLCYVHPEGLTSRYQLQMQQRSDVGMNEYALAYTFEQGALSVISI